MAHVRELPPLRLHLDVQVSSGRHYRWGEDEPRAENIPSGLRFSDTMPGGFESLDVTLARKPAVNYSDLERLSTIRVLGAGGDVAWDGRLERVPKVSGDQMAISPSAVGWQAHLEDDKSASMVFVDRDLGRWTNTSNARMASLYAAGNKPQGSWEIRPDQVGAEPALYESLPSPWPASIIVEPLYDSGPGNAIGRIRGVCSTTDGAITAFSDANYLINAELRTTEVTAGDTYNARAAGSGVAFDLVATTFTRRFAHLVFLYSVAYAGDDIARVIKWTNLRVFGAHQLPVAGTAPNDGLYASDMVIYAVNRWAPLLSVTPSTVFASSFVVPHATFYDATTAGEIVRQVTRFGLQDWAVWEDLTFWWHDRGTQGRKWRARVGPSQLEETGPQVERIWESVVVQYQDVDGSTRTVGPVGSGADTETDDLKDNDPENPANLLGITRRDLLVMGIGTAASATEIGRRFLEESKVLNTSGVAKIVGHIEDDRGVNHPYWRVRAGDTISFVDAADTSYRRIVRTDKSGSDRTCSIDLDSPPEGLQALLERLGVVLVSLGI